MSVGGHAMARTASLLWAPARGQTHSLVNSDGALGHTPGPPELSASRKPYIRILSSPGAWTLAPPHQRWKSACDPGFTGCPLRVRLVFERKLQSAGLACSNPAITRNAFS